MRSLITNNRNAENNVLRLYLRKEFAHDEQTAVRAARHIRNIFLEELIVSREVTEGIHPNDREWFDLWHSIMQRPLFHDMDQFYNAHIGRLLLHKASTVGLCTTPDVMNHICEQIRNQFDGNVTAVPSPTCLKTPVILLFVIKDVVKENSTAHNLTSQAFAHRLVREMPDVIDVNGVAGVTDVFVRGGPHAAKQDDFMVRQGFAEKDEYFIETNGGDLVECFATAPDLFDERRSFPSNPAYAHEHFGVEACRQILINELAKVLAETAYVDHHHVALLVDCMVQSGQLMSVTRQSQQKIKFSGILDIATFEQGIKVLTSAALRGAKDDLQGTSARVATGRPVKAGTGYFDLKLYAQ